MPSLEQLKALLAKSPDDAFLLYGVAMEHAKLGDHQTALDYFDNAIKADATNPYHYFHQARSLKAVGRVEDARAALLAGLEQAKTSSDGKALGELTAELDRLS